ncbi:DUF5060 domain-containing protein [Reichenbachiella ulvae]|uniref:DUF5060 domain-containing protein n=1 Tax=Reichenbachiella ulvae TaxID=2980104 RepID=A0ABT3CST9_9BACT|nr:DUF5060 domain-containing protein [Reichenbachiella ulvae]MCV9386677.1 DUF5060 domain-containing protein [Reichenbachiella ulvae]
MKKMLLNKAILLAAVCGICFSCVTEPQISGEPKKWHKITLTFDGPESDEMADINPFADYRLDVTFSLGDKSLIVPGYFAADGQAAYTSAKSGNKWRVHFSPNATGEWKYEVSFRKGKDIAISDEEGEGAGYMDGQTGVLLVGKSDKSAPDLRAKGRLTYVGEHYLQFAESGDYFVKMGADAPENMLAYDEIDDTPNVGDRLKKWTDHAQDYNSDADSFLWGPNKEKGKNLLGGINYLHEKGMNVFSFLTFNIDGDDRNVFPHLLKVGLDEYEEFANVKKNPKSWETNVLQDRFDVSKMDQWEQIFSYGEMKGMYLHFKTQENENDQKMDGGDLGRTRKLYYRQLIARYAHHLALNWNIGEEETKTVAQVKEQATYFAQNDPYQSIAVVHTFPNEHEKYYQPLVDEATDVKGFSIQTNKPDFHRVHSVTSKWVKASAASGRKLVVAVDEPGDARHALVPDKDNIDHNNARINALWGTLMAGGAGLEWYFGYQHDHSDLTCESWRSRDAFWDQCKVALDFFTQNELPLTEMVNMNEMTADTTDYVYAKNGDTYLVFIKEPGKIEMELPDIGYNASWLNPKTGEQITIDGQTENEKINLDSPFELDALLYLTK